MKATTDWEKMYKESQKALEAVEAKLADVKVRESYVKTIEENYEDLANELELFNGYRDEHFETIMEFINIIKPRFNPAHSFHAFGTPAIYRCNYCGQLKGKESKYCIS